MPAVLTDSHVERPRRHRLKAVWPKRIDAISISAVFTIAGYSTAALMESPVPSYAPSATSR